MPPPEWLALRGPNSVSAIAVERIARGEPVAHRKGARADLAWLFAHVEEARRSGDGAKERAYAAELARALVERGAELDQAARFARRALLLAEDSGLRADLAGWFALNGEFALAASTLRPLLTLETAPAEVSRLLTDIGSLLGRAGEATAAREAFEEALARNPSDPNPAELAAALAAWAPHVVSPEDAARFYLGAAGLREAKGERAAAFEDLLRAFEIAPGSEAAAERLARLLIERGRAGAADEVRREHARHVGALSQRVHERRFVTWLASGDFSSALAAALDAGLEISNPELDTLLERLALPRAELTRTGDDVALARALVARAGSLVGPVRAVLLSTAGELFLQAHELEEARRAADLAVAADPSRARALAARASVAQVIRGRWGAEAMERAMAVVVPRAELCAVLANTYEELGEPLLALAFGQRRIALRPGDPDAARDRLLRTLALGDAERLADALTWLLAQPQPLDPLAELVADALRALALRDPARGAALARRALDVVGPQRSEIRLAILAVADTTADRELGLAVLERWLASGAASSERVEILLDLARRRRAAGDSDGSLRDLGRAMREGASPTAVLAELDVTPPPTTSDGEIALLFVRAEALSAQSEADPQVTALAWRELGGAHVDLAGDFEAGFRAFERASALDPELGIENFASDLLAFAGFEAALARLEVLASERGEPRERARVLAVAAAIALESGRSSVALDAGVRALELDASRTDVLSIIERAAEESDIELLERTYTLLATGVLGRFGARSVHYRAARQLERRRAPRRALAHALNAFEAVPSEGTVFRMLKRLADAVGEKAELVRALERAASRESNEGDRMRWLERAAELTSSGEEGLGLRVDVLLRALHARPDLELLGALSNAVTNLLSCAPDEREVLALRVERALLVLAERSEGREGAELALASAKILVEGLDLPKSALRVLERAALCDANAEEYASFASFVPKLANDAGEFVDQVASLAVDARASVGQALISLGAQLAEERGDRRLAAEMLLHGGRKVPKGRELFGRAERIARAIDAQDLLGEVLEALALLPSTPVAEGAELLVRAARVAIAGGAERQAIERAERAARLAPGFAPAQLLFRELAYKERRFSQDAGSDAVEALSALDVTGLAPEDAELAAFLLAEARDAAGGDTGLDELEALNQSLGPRPLLALALAERLSRTGQVDQALGHFDVALAGDLRGLRDRSALALQAADAARLRGERERARGYLEIASEDPKLAERVANLERELRAERVVSKARFRPAIDPRVLVSIDRSFSDVGRYSERPPLEAREERPLVTVLPLTLSVAQRPITPAPSTPEPQSPAPTLRSHPSSPTAASRPSSPTAASRRSSPPPSRPSSPPPSRPSSPPPSRPSSPPPSRPSSPPESWPSSPPPSSRPSSPPSSSRPTLKSQVPAALASVEERALSFAESSSSKHFALSYPEAELYLALDEGSVDAGRVLARRLEGRPERARELVTVCRRLSAALPGELDALIRLHDAALADKNPSYARALEHAIHVLNPGSDPVSPPPLADQVGQPDEVRSLLLKELSVPALEALALVWEGAEHVFRRDPSSYGLTGFERIQLSAPNPLARVYSTAARALGLMRTPLYQRRSTGPVTVSLALLNPPSIVLSGDVHEESPELAYQIGAMLIGVMPQFALLLGAPESQARGVLSAMAFAFGPPDHTQLPGKVPNNLAELLWESIPARLQRRLRDLCSSREHLDYESVMSMARLAGRRAGLFTSGDLRVALTEVCIEEGIPTTMLESTGKIAELCASSAAIRSLILLATSAEYAQTRWQPARSR